MGTVTACSHLAEVTRGGCDSLPPLAGSGSWAVSQHTPTRDSGGAGGLTPAACRPRRVDPDCISPDMKNSIHVGDRILEINGTPIGHVPLDEVCSPQGAPQIGTAPQPPQTTPATLFCPQIDLLIQETSRLLQLTIEHDPHEPLARESGLACSPLPASCSPLCSPAPPPCGEPGTMRQRIVT